MRQGLTRALGGVAIVALVAGTAACNKGSSDSGTSAGGKNCGYSIGYLGALTGPSANLGVNIEQGAELAIEQYNKKNGKDCITIKKFDSQGSADVAPGLARQLVADKKIIGVVGLPFSSESQAANPILNDAKIPNITPSATNTTLSEKGWTYFHRAVANDSAQGPAAGNYMKSVMKVQKAFVVDDQSAYGVGLADQVKAVLGSAVVGSDKVGGEGKQTDFSATVTKVVASGATALFYGGYYQNAGLFRKQLTAAGWTGALVAGDGVNDKGYIQAAGKEAAEGTILTCPCAPASKAKGSFVTDYKARWNVDAGTYSDVAYDAANIYLEGISKGNTTTEKLNEYLKTVNYTGIANTYKFTDKGELDPTKLIVWAFKVSGGEVVPDQEAPKA
ncbi:branched-chain amino acid ABC transporter substrate-binding protein [Planosporangium mesophilum]|uniref:branched-chain amino acid ABC transporter substrate-binding protein n=1 Tax=Planosporangium mesophilum TaxID=689768 RepID=UPI00143A2DE3|nr:branched-chain amino acid ABC transporter substrate-binding protein [Planosporangium mesophilum]NJC83277.1 branched-chain amino acid ABC transporter substrate-binding protein [Planosporangium mesophilum]